MKRRVASGRCDRGRACMGLALVFSMTLAFVGPCWAQLPAALASPGCVACEIDAAQWRDRFSEEEWQQILEGEVVVSDRQDESSETLEGMVRADALLPHPPKQVWHVLTDFESRPEYISDVERIDVVRREGNRVWADEHLSFFFVDVRFRVINTIDPETGSISWELDETVPHDIADTEGRWQVRPLSAGQQTLLSYRTRVDTGRVVPGFIEKFLLTRSLPQFIRSLREEVARRSR